MHRRRSHGRWQVWIWAPLLEVACERSDSEIPWDPGPPCSSPDQAVSTDATGAIVCKPLPPGLFVLPSCQKYSQALTADGKKMLCTPRNNEAQTTRDALTRLEQSENLIEAYYLKIFSLGGPWGPPPRAVYCGQFSAAQNPNGAITDPASGVTGIAAAASLCRQVATCGARTAKMCTVYDLYYSAATGSLPSGLPPAWVFMAAWQHNDTAQVPTAHGLADNCSGYTYGLDDRLWYGTTFEWKAAPSGQRALHFASGPGVVSCASRFPIACCN